MQKILKVLLSATLLSFSMGAMADIATTAKEETTPPPPEGALAIDKVAPIMNIGAALPAVKTPPAANEEPPVVDNNE